MLRPWLLVLSGARLFCLSLHGEEGRKRDAVSPSSSIPEERGLSPPSVRVSAVINQSMQHLPRIKNEGGDGRKEDGEKGPPPLDSTLFTTVSRFESRRIHTFLGDS